MALGHNPSGAVNVVFLGKTPYFHSASLQLMKYGVHVGSDKFNTLERESEMKGRRE